MSNPDLPASLFQATPPGSLDQLVELEPKSKELQLPKTSDKPLPVMQEETRGKMARSLLRTYQIIIVMVIGQIIYGYFALLSTNPTTRDQKMAETQNQYIKELIALVLTSTTGILGTAIGFYFGKQDSK